MTLTIRTATEAFTLEDPSADLVGAVHYALKTLTAVVEFDYYGSGTRVYVPGHAIVSVVQTAEA